MAWMYSSLTSATCVKKAVLILPSLSLSFFGVARVIRTSSHGNDTTAPVAGALAA